MPVLGEVQLNYKMVWDVAILKLMPTFTDFKRL